MMPSLSARRAWIEMVCSVFCLVCPAVALRKERVDRNLNQLICVGIITVSLSARRAWIEIPTIIRMGEAMNESLSARRAWIEISISQKADNISTSRSPQGERG